MFDRESARRKIKALLAKSTEGSGATQPEAESALTKAHELMMEYAISEAEARNETGARASYVSRVAWQGKRRPKFQGVTAGLIGEFFNVKILIAPNRAIGVQLIFYGTSDACDFAEYAFSYLNDIFSTLWHRYKLEYDAETKDQGAYYLGLYHGFRNAMHAEQAKRTIPGTALMIIKKELDKAFHSEYKTHAVPVRIMCASADARECGQRDGSQVRVRRPLGGNSNQLRLN